MARSAVLISPFVLLACAISVQAAPPQLDWVAPAGVARGATVTVTGGGKFDTWPVEVWVSRPDLKVTPLKDKGQFEITAAPEAVPGLCWMRCYTADGGSSLRPLVIGTLPEVLDTGKNNDAKSAQVLDSARVTVNGRLDERNDVDIFSVPLEAGQTLVATLGANRLLGSPMDGVMQILSADGFVLTHDDDTFGLDPQCRFEAPQTGRYLVRIFAFPAMADSTIGLSGAAGYVYRLSLTTTPHADHAWPLALTADEAPEVALRGIGTDGLKAKVEFPTLPTDSSPVPLVEGLAWLPELSLTVPVARVAHATAVEQEPTGIANPQRIAVPGTVSGLLDVYDDADVFVISGKKGESVVIRLDAQAIGSLADGVLEHVQPDGKSVSRNDDVGDLSARDPLLRLTFDADGDRLIRVSDLHRRGGSRYFYRLSVTPAKPDFRLTVAADNFVLTPGKPLEIPVTVEREPGFTEPIEIEALHLPEGVTATVAEADPKAAEAAKKKGGRRRGQGGQVVKLVLTAEKAVAGAPIQIVGVTEEPALRRYATAGTSVPTARVDMFWLGVK